MRRAHSQRSTIVAPLVHDALVEPNVSVRRRVPSERRARLDALTIDQGPPAGIHADPWVKVLHTN